LLDTGGQGYNLARPLSALHVFAALAFFLRRIQGRRSTRAAGPPLPNQSQSPSMADGASSGAFHATTSLMNSANEFAFLIETHGQ
jgi:hypothetical protein